MNSSVLLSTPHYEPKISFIVSKAGKDVMFFTQGSLPPSTDFTVYINNNKTTQNYNSLTFNANDKVDIQLINGKSYYPYFYSYDKSYFKEILEPLPLMIIDGHEVNRFSNCFGEATALTSIPENLFANNPNITDFDMCFAYCTSLTSIPENLFANNPNVTGFSGCFSYCSSLQSIPENLFANNPNVTDFGGCFARCSSLKIFTLKIGSSKVSYCYSFYNIASDSNITIKVPSGSTTQTKFNSWKGSDSRITITPY